MAKSPQSKPAGAADAVELDAGKPPTAREVARAAVLADISTAARRQLAEQGAAALSLRLIARELGMVSSGIYRYVASRDELLTRLIIETYEELGAHLEAALQGKPATPRARWQRVASALRAWALAHPHDYALLYGSPVPDYAAPTDTIAPATRVYAALAAPLRDRAPDAEPAGSLAPLGLALDDDAANVALGVWMQCFGMVSFEVFGHTYGVIHDHDRFYTERIDALADVLGL